MTPKLTFFRVNRPIRHRMDSGIMHDQRKIG